MTPMTIALAATIGVLSALLLAACALGVYYYRHKLADFFKGNVATRYRKGNFDDAIYRNSLLYTTTTPTRTPYMQTPSSATFMGKGPSYPATYQGYHAATKPPVSLPARPRQALRSSIRRVAMFSPQEESLIGDVQTTIHSPGDIISPSWEALPKCDPEWAPKGLESPRAVTSVQRSWTPGLFSPAISSFLDQSDGQRPTTVSSYATAMTSVLPSLSGDEGSGHQAEYNTPSTGLGGLSLLQALPTLTHTQNSSLSSTGTGDMTQTLSGLQSMIEVLRQSVNTLQRLASPRLSLGQMPSLSDSLPEYTSAPGSTEMAGSS